MKCLAIFYWNAEGVTLRFHGRQQLKESIHTRIGRQIGIRSRHNTTRRNLIRHLDHTQIRRLLTHTEVRNEGQTQTNLCKVDQKIIRSQANLRNQLSLVLEVELS